MDYIENGRPVTAHETLFVRARAPVAPYKDTAGIFRIVSKYMALSGIDLGDRNHGPHSLRNSLASSLLESKTSLPVIAAALGHISTKNTSRYIRIDMEHLRSVALEVLE
jgi:site-specific recombinase XerD